MSEKERAEMPLDTRNILEVGVNSIGGILREAQAQLFELIG